MKLDSSVTQQEDTTRNQFHRLLGFYESPKSTQLLVRNQMYTAIDPKQLSDIWYKYRSEKVPLRHVTKSTPEEDVKRFHQVSDEKDDKKDVKHGDQKRNQPDRTREELWKGRHSIGHQGKEERRQRREEERQWETCLPEGRHSIQLQGGHTFESIET